MAIGNGLLSLYKLDANSNDSAGSNNYSTIGGSVTYSTSGGRSFGTFNPGELETVSTVDLTGNCTVSFWAETGTPYNYFGNTYSSFFRWGSAAPSIFDLYLLNGKIRAYHSSSGGASDNRGTVNVPAGWNHYAITFNPSTGTKVVYLNGVAQSLTGTGFSGSFGSPQDSILGNISNGNAAFRLNGGNMDDVGTWQRDLSAVEILEIYNAGTAGIASLLGVDSDLQGQFASVVHTVAASDNNLEGQFASVVHTVAASDNNLEGQWLSVVHTVPSPAAIVPDIVGSPGVAATFDGSASVGVTYYHWSWVTVPGGSSVANAAIPFPDNGAATPLDMTNNEGLWHFEGNANDTSGNVRNGTVTGASLVAGKVGAQAYQFGVADNVNFGAASSFISSNFTISLWIKGDAAWTPATWDSITGASNGFTWSQGFGIFWQNATTIRCFVGAYTGSYADITASSITSWNHVVMTYDGSNITAFWNGAQASQTAHSSALTGLTNDFFVSYLGTHGGGEQSIDEVAIWSRAISASEITDIYAAQSGLVAGVGSSSFSFTPDIDGTYTVKLAISATVDTTADCVVTSPSGGGGDPIQGASSQGGRLQGSDVDLQGKT